MSQRYNDNIKRPKPQERQLEILKTYAFCQKIQQRASVLGESAMRIDSKSCCIFHLKVAATLLKGSGKGAIGT